MTRSPPHPRNLARPTGGRPSQHRHIGPYLWVLQGWMAMFFLAAAFAKLTAPMEHLVILMTWPEWVSPDVVLAIGYGEATLAIGLLIPILFDRRGWPIMRVSAAILSLNAAVMIVLYSVLRDLGLVATNAALLAMGLCILMGRGSELSNARRVRVR